MYTVEPNPGILGHPIAKGSVKFSDIGSIDTGKHCGNLHPLFIITY